MKRIFIVALFVLGMCNVSVFGMVQEITLSELYSIMPLDDAKETSPVRRSMVTMRASDFILVVVELEVTLTGIEPLGESVTTSLFCSLYVYPTGALVTLTMSGV